jgi:cell wall-associated NlpC family hydrolase
LPHGSSVSIRGSSENGWWPVICNGQNGWASGQYLTEGYVEEEQPQEPTQPSGNGAAIANFAMQYVGYPYVWAGNTPSGFDCSGFTQYVVQNVLGYNITHSTDNQVNYGPRVSWDAWQQGDLLFFTNTGGSGYLTHVGIYIGDGQFVHAENENTGVRVSSIYSNYYSSHYNTAIRLV